MNELTNQLIDAATLNESPLYLPDVIAVKEEPSNYESEALTKYVTSGLDEHKNNDVVKVMAAALQIASESGAIEAPAIGNPLQTAIAAVDMAKNLNVAYLIDQGEILADEAADALIDQAAANISVIAETVLQPSVIEMGLNRVLDLVSAVWPQVAVPAQWAKKYTPAVASFISEKVKPAVMRGIPMIAQEAKSLAHQVIAKVTAKVKATANKVGQKQLALL